MTRTTRKEPRIEKVTLTRELAEKLRGLNVHNRNIRPRVVAAYARDMVNGNWFETGDTIKVSNTGKLLDGQHRIDGYLKALEDRPDLTLPVWIAWDLDEDAQDSTDAGARRLLYDVLRLKKKRQSVALAATLRIVNAWQMGERRGLGSNSLATNATLLELLREMPELEDIACQAVLDATKCALPPSVLGLTRWLFSDIDTGDTDTFFDMLTSDESIVKGHPIYELRRAARRSRDGDGRRRQAYLVALTIKAWNMWRQGQQLDGSVGLSFRMGGTTPERFPEPM